ncbi:MAG: SusD/RagB family nutrient-binding outer membrane lipoprotein [Marinilabiliales bacterium]|nr:SusD/RagB family nutrient-binding outer membrane lipoprotein [Marinilabiliales bacterium]
MMQKWVALYPWGATEAWVDMRKYHYDIAYTGDYPASGNGWDLSTVTTNGTLIPTRFTRDFICHLHRCRNRKDSLQYVQRGFTLLQDTPALQLRSTCGTNRHSRV